MKLSMILSTYILAILTLGSCAPSISCPSAGDLAPCTCKRLAYGLHVVCANFDKNTDLIKAFRVLRNYNIQNVLLYNLSLKQVLPSDIFEGLDINELKVEKSKLKFSQPAFTGLDESLHVLNVAQQSMIKTSEEFSLARLTKLTELNIKSNSLKTVKNKWLNDKIPSVHTVILDEDEISEIESNAFSGLTQLKSISLADNRIRSVSRSMFPRPALKLTKIDLSANEITTIPFDFFYEMPSLQEVILSMNDIQTLPERTWISVWEKLDRILLQENSLVCDEQMDWLRRTRWPNGVYGNCVQPKDAEGKSIREMYGT